MSYIKSLEDRVAYLETQLATRDSMMDLHASTRYVSPTPLAGSSLPRDPVDQIALHSLEGNPFYSSIVTTDGQSLLRSLLAEPMRSVAQSNKPTDHRSLLDQLPGEIRAEFPGQEASARLMEAYFEHCEFFSPVIPSKDDFYAAVASLYAAGGGPTHMAHPAETLARFRSAESYFATAVQIMAQNDTVICTGDLDHLCNLLLIVQYTCFASNLTAAWHFLGMASRLAVELSLHDERAMSGKLDEAQLNERRWLFWALYTSERNLCVILGRPFSIPDEAIETPLPELPEGHTSRALLDPVAWREGMRQRITEWISTAPISPAESSTQLAPSYIFGSILRNKMVLLYYPSPLFPTPSELEIKILAQSAGECIRDYRAAFRDGQLRFFWRTTHNLFRSGVAMAYCVHVQSTRRYAGLNQADMMASVNMCVSILWAMVERYPAGRVYRDAFENLADSLLKSAEDPFSQTRSQNEPPFGYDATILADMDLPQPAVDSLYWGFGVLT
ncbi:hypothetical protein ACHAQA_002808 [Verticillium albo-atrum]